MWDKVIKTFWEVILFSMTLLGLSSLAICVYMAFAFFVQTVQADEPIIAIEFEYENDSITVGTMGEDSLNLYTKDDLTIGTAGDQVILIDRSFRSRLDISVEPDLFPKEDIRNPLKDSRD